MYYFFPLTLCILETSKPLNGFFGKQWRPRWNAAYCCILLGSALIAKIKFCNLQCSAKKFYRRGQMSHVPKYCGTETIKQETCNENMKNCPIEFKQSGTFGKLCVKWRKNAALAGVHDNLENCTCDPLKYTMDSPIHIISICMGTYCINMYEKIHQNIKKVSEYDQEIPQSHTADQPTARWGRTTGHL